jgi:serine protease Do
VTPGAASPGLTVVQPKEEGLGSGVVIDTNGLILTNAHVIDGAGVIHIRTPDGDDVKATVIGTDPDVDLALLRASDARGLRPAPLGDSDRLQVGDWVVAIGNPLGLHHTVTAGIVSAKARTLDDSGVEYLQTDAAVSPGSSGGPLLDLSGRVVGINVGILSTGGQNVGLNVAIPVAVVKEVLPRLLKGAAVHGWIGVTTAPLSARGATARGLSGGLVVTAITDHGPARRAGINPGDVVIGVADDPALTLHDFYRHVRGLAPGTVLRVTVWRNSERVIVPVEIGRRPPPDDFELPSIR